MATRCWDDCIHDRSIYILLLEDHLFALTSASQELMVKRNDILTRVNLAEQQQSFKRLNEVQLWLSSVDSAETQVNILINNGPGKAAEISGMGDKVFPMLKFSYDNLQNDKIRSCFLFCTLFPEDYNIPKDSLIDYWIEEGSFDGDVGRREAANEGYGFIGTSSRACLLEDARSSVKMHDVIRDLALWISSEGGKAKDNYLVITGAQLTKVPPDVAKCKNIQRMLLVANKINYLCRTPKWKNLQSLILSENTLCMIPSDLFQFMTSLYVLDLSEDQYLVTLPFGISKLVSLEYLNLSSTKLQHLPMELTALVNLKYLNLEHTPIVYKFPLQLMSGFSNLQVLRMDRL